MRLKNQETKAVKKPSRRRFLRDVAVAGSVYCLSPNLLVGCRITEQASSESAAIEQRAGVAVMDEALAMFARTGPEYWGGLANHGPMAAEALVTLGRSEAVLSWVERYKRNLRDEPQARKAVTHDNWREGLGDINRVGDWIAFFNRELQEASWRAVLGQWTARLAPGLVAAAAHGLIRTGHAARSLGQSETPTRKQELAQGLAYWAARYQRLPLSGERSAPARLQPSEAIKQVETLTRQGRVRGLIADSLSRLDNFPPFAKVAGLVDANVDAPRFISNLTETFAHVYLANTQSFGSVIAFIHAVTGPSTIRLLLPYVKAEDAPDLLRYGWQAAAGLYAAFGNSTPSNSVKQQEQNKDDLIDRAVANGDEHAIKFTETCLREHALNPKPVYLLAARHAVDYLRQA